MHTGTKRRRCAVNIVKIFIKALVLLLCEHVHSISVHGRSCVNRIGAVAAHIPCTHPAGLKRRGRAIRACTYHIVSYLLRPSAQLLSSPVTTQPALGIREVWCATTTPRLPGSVLQGAMRIPRVGSLASQASTERPGQSKAYALVRLVRRGEDKPRICPGPCARWS